MGTMLEATENKDSKEIILWVDDEKIALEVCSQMLQKLGYTVLQARHGYEALEIFEKNKDRLKEIRSEIKIIIFSGCIDQYAIDKLSKRNFSDYVEKPLELKELSEKIEEVLERP